MKIEKAMEELEHSKGVLFVAELGKGRLSFFISKSLESLKGRLKNKYQNLSHGQAWIYQIDSKGERIYKETVSFNCEEGCSISKEGVITHTGQHHLLGMNAIWKRSPKHTDNEYQLALAQWLEWFEKEYKADYQDNEGRLDG